MNKLLTVLLLSFSILNATPISVNSPISSLETYKFQTPNGRQMKVPKKTKIIVIAFKKDTAALVDEYLATKNRYYLQRNKAIYIADIHKMPTIITDMIALPKLRKYKHLIYLHYGNKFQKNIPYKEDKITILKFSDKKVIDISFINTKQELQNSIEKL